MNISGSTIIIRGGIKMNDKVEQVVHKLIERKETIATMESCTGGCLANTLTSIPGVSEVFHFGAVTYSNGYKIKMGVPKSTIDAYTVYSKEVARAMAKAISDFTTSTYGVGVTGKMNIEDPANPSGEDDVVYYAIYSKSSNTYLTKELKVSMQTRKENKEYIISYIIDDLLAILS